MHALCAFSTRRPKVAKRGQSARSGTQVPREFLNRNIATSLAMYTFLAVSVDKSKSQQDSEFFISSLVELARQVCQSLESAAAGTIEFGTESIVIDRHGDVTGFNQCLSQRGVHKA